jgi:hypothetical protein
VGRGTHCKGNAALRLLAVKSCKRSSTHHAEERRKGGREVFHVRRHGVFSVGLVCQGEGHEMRGDG